MKEAKDNFSDQSEIYARYRPAYPPELYSFLISLVNEKQSAWDCGTGNGQVAMELSNFFEKVYATDLSEEQIKNAVQRDNIFYCVERAEYTSFEDNSFDLIVVAQAIHWFDFNNFYKEANRTAKSDGILAIIGYGLLMVDEETDWIIDDFYKNTIGLHWDKERRYIDEGYQTIPFPFKDIKAPQLINILEWDLEEITGYFKTWSAVQHYVKANNKNPVDFIRAELEKIWPKGTTKKIQFPILIRVAKIEK
ncbi:MAG: class I SAM-dependent methyltransferase [Ferruginibacter sp.]